MPTLLIKQTPNELARSVALRISDYTNKLKNNNLITIAFSGGTTPSLLFGILAQDYIDAIPWEKIHIFLVDERWVPFVHKNSNYRLLKTLLLDNIPILKDNVHPMPVEASSYQEAINLFENTLQTVFQIDSSSKPSFDLILLGLGGDGHTASLFPNEDENLDQKLFGTRWVSIPFVKKLDIYRMTLTMEVINQAKQVWFLVTGSKKAEMVKNVIIDSPKDNYPACKVKPINGPALWCLDADASEFVI